MLNKLSQSTILFVQNDDLSKAIYKGMIKRQGVKNLFMADTLDIGYEVYKINKLDIVIIDLTNFSYGGLDFIKNIKKDNKDIIIVTIVSFKDEVKSDGIDLIVAKPISIKKIFQKVELLVQNK
ncbi:MAG: response regulator [Campylobacterales bacterium]|nr:response regulator [Campylobacterales bacterium]